MKSLMIATFLLLTATIAQAQASTEAMTEKCYSLYMRENSDDPAYACVVFEVATAEAKLINLYMIQKVLKETIVLESIERVVGDKGRIILHYNDVSGTGQFHTVRGSQNYGSLQLMSLRVYSTADGHLQQALEFARPRPKPGNGCLGRRCR